MRRGLVLLTAALLLLPGCHTYWGGSHGAANPDAQANMRGSIPAIEAWHADHGTYAGMTVPLLRQQYDAGVEGITLVGPLNKETYCVQSTLGSPTYFKAGPAAEIREGYCPDTLVCSQLQGDPHQYCNDGTQKLVGPPPPPTSYGDAQTNVRAAIPAIEAWNADHGSYASMTMRKLRAKYDYGIPTEVKIVRASKASYCIESSVGGKTYSYRGPQGPLASGGC